MNELTTRIITGLVLSIIFIAVHAYQFPIPSAVFWLAILMYVLIIEWPRIISPKTLTFWLITPLYPILPFLCLIKLNLEPTGNIITLILAAFVAVHDTGSYLIGKYFGKTKLAPRISPKKTWEGFAGGLIAVCTVLFIFKLWNPALRIGFFQLTLTSFALCAIATAGDLFESWLKRRAGLKDSGNLLPGHGGLLDRFDGLLFVITLFYLYLLA